MPAIIALVPPDATKAPRRMDSTPLNPKGRELRRMEREGTERIHAALEKWGRSLFRGVTAETVALITARLDDPEYSKPLRDALIAFLQDTANAGAEFGRKQVEQVFMGVKRTPVLDAGAVDWTVANADAAQWAIEYGYQLIGGITDTTRAQVAREIRYFVDNSITVNQLRDRLMAGNLFSRNRASMIAVTETTRAYASGNEAAWRASQVVEGKEWMTAYDEAVCPICAPLSGKIVKLNESFGRVDKPPAHVNCRCWILPVVIGDTEVLSEVGVGPWGDVGAGGMPSWLRAEIDEIGSIINTTYDEVEKLSAKVREYDEIYRRDRLPDGMTWKQFDKQYDKAIAARDRAIAQYNARIHARMMNGGHDIIFMTEDQYRDIQNEYFEGRGQMPTGKVIIINTPSQLGGRFDEYIDAIKHMSSMIDDKLLAWEDGLTLDFDVTVGRAYYQNKTIYVTAASENRTVIHEMGHWIEGRNQQALESIQKWYDGRVGDEPLRPLSELTGDSSYGPGEIGRKDQFIHPYMGKVNSNGRGEILSMGMEWIYNNPRQLYLEDRDMFEFIYGLMRGAY